MRRHCKKNEQSMDKTLRFTKPSCVHLENNDTFSKKLRRETIPKTPDFHVPRTSLLDLDNLTGDIDSTTGEKRNISFEGFVNLVVIFLVSTCALLVVENYAEKGILVDLELVRCMSGDLFRCLDLVFMVVGQVLSVYVVSRFQMLLLNSNGSSMKRDSTQVTVLHYLIHLICALAYVVCLVGFFSSVVFSIFVKRVSLLVSCVITMTLMVSSMKLHSYYAYVFKTFSASNPLPSDIVHMREYLYFMFAPTLCFFRSYPRTKRIRLGYALKECMLFLGSIFMVYIIVMQYIDPVIREQQNKNATQVFRSVLRICVPWFITWLLASFAIFHALLNLIAELTYFGDRLWYREWWNSQSFEEFWKLWNRPVHYWLLRHVYFQSLRLKFNRPVAILFTFLLSAIIHELCMCVIFRTVQYYFFSAMLVQVPFVYLGNKLKKYESLRRIGNICMWLSLFAGQPLMILLYFKNWYENERALCDIDHVANSKYEFSILSNFSLAK